MGKNFWPIYIIVAALSLAATWKYAPALGEKIPPASRAAIFDVVAKCFGKTVKEASDTVPAAPAAAASGVKPLVTQRAAAPKALAPKKQTVQPLAATAKPAARSAAPQTEEEDDLPSLKGVMQADAQTASWGVLNQITTVTGLDGEEKGAVAGGRFFLIESREQSERGLVLVGNFTPTPMAEPVRVPAMNLYCFSGKPDSLSQRQRDCLRKYYELRGEAMAIKSKLLRENALRSPYGKQAAAAMRAFKEKAAEVERMKNADGEANRKATYELSQLRVKMQELTQKHKDWKKAHAAELPDPEKNPAYQAKLQEARAYSAPIAGLAF